MVSRFFRWLLVSWVLLVPALAHAESPDRSKWGFDLEAFHVNTSGYGGLAAGFHNANYIGNSDFNYGYAIYAGSGGGILSIGSHDHLYYAGFTLGSEGLLSSSFTYELNLLGGFSSMNLGSLNASGESLVLQPSAGIGVLLGYGWRTVLSIGELYFPKIPNASGFTVNIRIDRKITVSTHEAND